MKNTFVVISSAGRNRDLSKGTREQPFWDQHAEFIDRLVAEGSILMGGPLVDEGGSLLIFNAEDLAEIAHLIDAGKIKPVVTQVLPLSEAIAAQQQAAAHHTRGKLVLRIADDPKG